MLQPAWLGYKFRCANDENDEKESVSGIFVVVGVGRKIHRSPLFETLLWRIVGRPRGVGVKERVF